MGRRLPCRSAGENRGDGGQRHNVELRHCRRRRHVPQRHHWLSVHAVVLATRPVWGRWQRIGRARRVGWRARAAGHRAVQLGNVLGRHGVHRPTPRRPGDRAVLRPQAHLPGGREQRGKSTSHRPLCPCARVPVCHACGTEHLALSRNQERRLMLCGVALLWCRPCSSTTSSPCSLARPPVVCLASTRPVPRFEGGPCLVSCQWPVAVCLPAACALACVRVRTGLTVWRICGRLQWAMDMRRPFLGGGASVRAAAAGVPRRSVRAHASSPVGSRHRHTRPTRPIHAQFRPLFVPATRHART